MHSNQLYLAAGDILTVASAGGSTGSAVRLSNIPGSNSLGSTAIGAGESWTFGPFGTTTRWQIDSDRGELVTSQAPDEDSATVGAKAGATVTARESGDDLIRRTILTLADTPISFQDDAGVGQFGSVTLYDMPAGNIVFLGAVVDVDLALTAAAWTDTAAGDVGLGTTAVTDGDALATTEQNIIPTTAIAAMVAQVGPINAQSISVLGAAAAGGTDTDVALNVRIDDAAAHMADLVTNGAFGSDASWTKGTGWTIAAGVADSDGTQEAVSDLAQTPTELLAGISYLVTFTLTRSAGSVTAVIGGTSGTARATADTFAESIIAGADGTIALRASADFVGTVDDVSVVPETAGGVLNGTVTLTWLNAGDY
jgi:hypothetical protein